MESSSLKMHSAISDAKESRHRAEALTADKEKLKASVADLKRQLKDRDRRLSIVATANSDKEQMLNTRLEDLQREAEQLRKDKEAIYNQMVDEKAKLSGALEDRA